MVQGHPKVPEPARSAGADRRRPRGSELLALVDGRPPGVLRRQRPSLPDAALHQRAARARRARPPVRRRVRLCVQLGAFAHAIRP